MLTLRRGLSCSPAAAAEEAVADGSRTTAVAGKIRRVRGDARWDETWHRLLNWTNGQGPAERLAAQVLLADGFVGLDPSHPLGGKDGGADALAERDGLRWTMAAYFPRGQQTPKSITDKFAGDFEGMAAHHADGMAFVTNQELRLSDRRGLDAAVGGPTRVYHLERLVALLDQPSMYGVRKQFLDIEPPVPGELEAGERLAELVRASVARCAARWVAVGLRTDEAQALATDPAVGAPADALLPDAGSPVVVWTASMGSGKSIAGDRVHQRDLESAARSPGAPVPVFIAAVAATPVLEQAVKDAAEEVGDPRRYGARVVVDGVDEIGYHAAEGLLTQARVLAGTWPDTTVLLTSRPVPVLVEAAEHRPLPALDPEASRLCVEIGASAQVHDMVINGLAESIKATLGQPMFALLTGVWLRERRAAPRAPIDLLSMLGERATRELAVDERILRHLAVASVSRELGAVPSAEVIGGTDVGALLATGMVAERAGGLVFALPAIAQWFAARALLVGEKTTIELLEAPEDLELWRYPLGLAVALGSADRVDAMLAPLVERQVGFALRVLDAAFGHAMVGGGEAPPWREAGRRIRQAQQRLADGLGPAAPLIADTDAAGRVPPIAVASGGDGVTVAFYRGDEHREDVFAFPADFDLLTAKAEWGTVRATRVGPGATWAWAWAFSGARSRLNSALKHRGFPIPPNGPLAHEEAFACALTLANRNILTATALDIDPLLESIDEMLAPAGLRELVVLRNAAHPDHDLRGVKAYLQRLREDGTTRIASPLPPPDRSGGGWIGGFYSDERLIEVGTALYEQALIAYRSVVERWLPTLSSQLEHYVLLPVRVHGFITNGSEGEHVFGAIPMMSGYLEALSERSNDEVEMCLGGFDWQRYDHVYGQHRAARPAAARWLSGSIGGMSFEVGDRYPIADVVYSWLTHDLARLTLASTLAARGSSDALVRWDTRP